MKTETERQRHTERERERERERGRQRERERERRQHCKKDTFFFNFLCIEIDVLMFYLLKIKSLLLLLL